jgi:protein ImuB
VADPVPVELLDADGLAVRLAEPDLLSAPPVVLAGIPGPAGAREPRAVSAWAGPWPVVQRWWAAEGRATSRLQLVCADGTAYLLTTGEGRWWVTGVYD